MSGRLKYDTLADIDPDANEIAKELPFHSKTDDAWSTKYPSNAKVFRGLRGGRQFITIWPETGGWLGVYLEDVLGDIAPGH